jgi:hypothetical protein
MDELAYQTENPQPIQVPSNCVVGVHKETGRMLISGEGCLPKETWDIKIVGSHGECRAYIKNSKSLTPSKHWG